MTTDMQPRQRLQSLLDTVRRRWRAHAALRVLGRAAAAGAVPILALVPVTVLLPLGDGVLLAAVAAVVLAAIAASVLVASRCGARELTRRLSDRQIARFVEERAAVLASSGDGSGGTTRFDDELVSAAAASEATAGASAFAALIVDAAAGKLQDLDPRRIVAARDLRRAAFEAAAGVALLTVSIFAARPAIGRAVDAAWLTLLPGTLRVDVVPGDVRVAAGKPLTVTAVVRARGRTLTGVTPNLVLSDGPGTRTLPMTAAGGRFELAFESIDRSFRYSVAAGSSRSQEYSVTALAAPRVRRIDLRYEYPAFTRTPPREEIGGGDIFAPTSTTVRVRIHTDKPVVSGRLALGRAGDRPLNLAGDRLLEGSIVLSQDDSYRIALADADDLQSSGETEYFIRVMEDRPPDIRIVRPDGDQEITPLEEVAIEARAEDDHGVAKMELVYAVAGRPRIVVPLNGTGTDTVKTARHVLTVEDLKVQPGDVISYYARARDVSRGKRATEASSDMFFLEVRPFSEEFVSAQSQSMTGTGGDQIDALIAAQKEIISATWNVERRASAGAGRSGSDVSAIAAAQSELKARAEQMTGASRGRGVLRSPQQIAPPRQAGGARPAADPVGSAISAMGRAVDRLQGQRPGDALAHEMAALQALLQAQAEIRRHEVAQAGASSGGMGRQGQDLSALFDKELQRQQRTNYETQSRAEQSPDRQDHKSALDAIRDLAQRQEDLARRQRELAGTDRPSEERKRELEQLTREQHQLRERADELARRLEQRGASQQGDGGSGMRSASEQMRSAANDLQRQDLSSASNRSGRAASALRRLEQQMQADTSGSRQRASGELRMEAQQIAEEQRRIAGEAGRLDKGSPDREAWRRLAGEKDTLADRVDELQRSARQLAASETQGGDAAGGGRTAGAADDLQQQRIAGRMRDAAKDMRGEAGAAATGGRAGQTTPPRRAEAEQEIARALDRIVDRLSGTTGVEEIANALGESRGMRERLDRLEDQIREAEAQQRAGKGPGGRGGSGSGQSDRLQQLRAEYAREAQRTRQTLSRLERSAPGAGVGGTSPEGHEWSVTDQGTEAFKQDFSQWETLKKDVTSALERYEASVVARAARQSLRERLSGGGSDRVPDAYRDLIARYYESLARKP